VSWRGQPRSPAPSKGGGNVSPRHLTRLFHDELKTTSARYVELVRFDTAKGLLDAGHSVTEAALRTGFGSPETLRRAFIQHVGVSPRSYQQRFRSAIGAAR
jgi:transcriptional regulator GlxA family with amidase domain